MSDSLRPHALYSSWNSPGQNTGVGSLSLFQGIFPIQGSNPGLPHCRWILNQLSYQGSPLRQELCVSVTWLCPTLCDPMDCSLPGSSIHGILQAKNTRVGSHSLLQGIFPTQGLNPGLLHCRQILYCLSQQGCLKYWPWRE